MLNKFKRIILFSVFSLFIVDPNTSWAWYNDLSYWNYHGSGRDHAYSEYIDRQNYIGPADYTPIDPVYIDEPLVISNMPPAIAPQPAQSIVPMPAPSELSPDEFAVNIPNAHGGYKSIIIKKSRNGFVGPRGEYYPEFPKVFQLQMKYGD